MIHILMIKALLFGLALAFGTLIQGAEARTAPEVPDRRQIQRLVVAEAEATTIPPSLALALAKVESDFQAKALSEKGARGVMQIMPRTARQEFGVEADELWQPRLNIQLGLSFLEQLISRYGGRWDLALSHYNGGTLHGTGASAKAHGFTRRYVQLVLRWQKRYAGQEVVWRDATAEKSADGWTPARTRPAMDQAAGSADEESAASIDWRRLRRIALRRQARAERAAARAEHRRRRQAERLHRRLHDHDWAHDGDRLDLDDFSPFRGRVPGRRG
ncbi:MAG: lytic transglycosylase domain-containing protein [Alphaproteobacteria bacterium]|jgi:hypothetical protein|nr:lytic transglycosylase domain-containing protein [Alphaproteobacteria bacterium]MDP6829878.1 lytic transglycosylase domain-containing protein [Alphaproteobacteria bacterium]MDP6875742.1 lytic transglycosylase domain-containing protein [Alphaproteobacteria bacterium]